MWSVEHYSRKSKLSFLILNISLIIISIGMFISYTIIKMNYGISSAKILGIVFICSMSLFFLINLIKIYLEYSKKMSITKNIVRFIDEKKYLEAKEYLEQKCKKVNFYSNFQMILYYLGYLELSLDNLNNAKGYFCQIDMKKLNYTNAKIIASTIFLLGMIYQYEKDTFAINDIIKTINDKKRNILSLTKNNVEIDTILNIILNLNSGDKIKGIENLKSCRFKDMPFIQRYVNNNCN